MKLPLFITMYNLAPVGKHFIQVCTTTPCLLRGADKNRKNYVKKIFLQMKTKFQKKVIVLGWKWNVLGACVSAPMVQINERLL